VHRLSGKTVALSFWAKASAAGLKLGINGVQNFGTGGSPSATVPVLATGLSVTLTSSWARYSVSFAIPSIAGKTLGTNNNDYTAVQLCYSSGATSNVANGNTGIQNGSIFLWGVQLEVGSAATPLEKLGPQLELGNCQRFYLPGEYGVIATAGGAGSYVGGVAYFPTTMRAAPTIAVTPTGTDTNISTTNAPDNILPGGFRFSFTSMAVGYIEATRKFTASAEL
jgi:hypothetical protein